MAEPTQQEQFEHFVRTQLGDVPVMDQGRYISPKIQKYWLTWQAAIARQAELIHQWRDAYVAFTGAFDTPLARRKDSDEYTEDARRRLREFDELLTRLFK